LAETVLEARQVTKIYRAGAIETLALASVDLAIERGEFSALSGPSGSGKTTLLNLLGTLDRPTSGRILVSGQTRRRCARPRAPSCACASSGSCSRRTNLVPVLSALENVEFVLLLQGAPAAERRARARQCLEALGLGELCDKRPERDERRGSNSAWPSRARSRPSRRSCSRTSPPRISTRRPPEDLLDLMQRLNRERGRWDVPVQHARPARGWRARGASCGWSTVRSRATSGALVSASLSPWGSGSGSGSLAARGARGRGRLRRLEARPLREPARDRNR